MLSRQCRSTDRVFKEDLKFEFYVGYPQHQSSKSLCTCAICCPDCQRPGSALWRNDGLTSEKAHTKAEFKRVPRAHSRPRWLVWTWIPSGKSDTKWGYVNAYKVCATGQWGQDGIAVSQLCWSLKEEWS